jgi:hypothetical protein
VQQTDGSHTPFSSLPWSNPEGFARTRENICAIVISC